MRKRNHNGFGCIDSYLKNGKRYWRARYTDPITHKQIPLSGKSYADCARKLKETQSKICTGTYVAPSKETVSGFLDDWISHRVNITESTRETYKRNIDLHIKPHIGKIKMQDLKNRHCQELVYHLMHDHSGEKALHPKTIQGIVRTLSKAMSDAVRAELIPVNPASGLELPRIVKKTPGVLESTEEELFCNAIRNTPYERLFLFALYSGARISEVLGLQWGNVNRQTCEVHINSQLLRKNRESGSRELRETKNHKGRTIILPQYVMDLLKAQDLQQKQWKLKAGPLWKNDNDLVFTRQDGSPMPHTTVTNAFKRAAKKIGREDLSFHSLRHTYAVDELRNGTDPKTISETLGHSTITLTMDTYAVATHEMKKNAAERRQAAFEKANA